MSSQSPADPNRPPDPPPPLPARSRNRWVLPVVALVIAGGVLAWALTRPKPKDNLVAASEANARGVGYMDMFEYKKALSEFEETVKLAPNWLPGKINLGIALLNAGGTSQVVEEKEELIRRSLAVFKEVLDKEPNNPHANYCTGMIVQDRGKFSDALPHYEAVTRVDPKDANAWLRCGMCRVDASESPVSLECFEKALKLNPFLNTARYQLYQHVLIAGDEKRRKRLGEEFETMKAAEAAELWDSNLYTESGRYAECIGKSPAPPPGLGVMPMFEPAADFSVPLAQGTTWASADKLDDLRKAVRARFGGGVILFDFNGDGKPDILLLSAVIRNGSVGDLLLRNDGGYKFTDVTAEAGLAAHPGSFGGAAADYDCDGFQDLALAGPAGLKLFRNTGGKGFEDKTAAAGFDKEPGVYLTATWLDIDQDSDLDLIAAKYAATPELAIKLLKGEKVDGKGRLCVFQNVGESLPVPKGQFPMPLKTAFKPATGPEALLVQGPVTGIVAADLDGMKDTDLVVLLDGQPPVTVLNERMFRFRRGQALLPSSGGWTGGLVLDANGDEQGDLVLLDPAGPPNILVSKTDEPANDVTGRFAPGHTNSPPLCSAAWVDLNLDGRTDLLGLSANRKPVFLQGDGGGKFTLKQTPFGPEAEAIPDLLAVFPMAVEGCQLRDVFCWSEASGLKVFRNKGNGNNALRITLRGKQREEHTHGNLRSNYDGIGAWVRLHIGPLTTAAENTTLFAGLGQSRLPLHFGIGKASTVDALCMRWPDAQPQGEVSLPAGCLTVHETYRKPDSCPTIFLWDGERFVFHTDCLGAGSMGELDGTGATRPPRPEESVKIEPGAFLPRNGRFVLKIGEPMDEVMYLDFLQLDAIDHPAGTSVFPDERFATAGPPPTQERLFFRDGDRIFPARAIDQRGRDVTAVLRDRDGKMVDDFAVRAWLGFAEEHWVELDFAGRVPALVAGQKLYLVLAGWTDYPYPESIFAAEQAGVPIVWPVLEQKQADGAWKNLGEIGLPAGLPRVMTADVTGLIDPKGGPIRIRTNAQIYWDQVFLAPAARGVEVKVTELPAAKAMLEHRGFVQEVSQGPNRPVTYNYDRLEPVLYTKWRGKLTRTGDVTELLTGDDDHFAICGPGDEITAEFDAAKLPPLPAGWQRSFVLRTKGYCKDTALATATSSQVGPLPHRKMSNYPYDPVKEPLPQDVKDYDRRWNTR